MTGCSRVSLGRQARPLWLTGVALTIGLLAALVAGSASSDVRAQTCAGTFTSDFAGLPAGTILGEQYASSGVHISGEGHNNGPDALIVFDSDSTDPDLDSDLRVGIGNIAIFANNLTDVDPADGLVDRPDENNFGGRAVFSFDQDVSIGSFTFVDKDHTPDDSAVAYDADGNVITQVAIPPAGNGSVQTIAVNADGVRRFEIVYGDSGGFTGIEVDCGQPSPTPTATAVAQTPTPTAAAETPTPAAVTATPTTAPATPTTAPIQEATPTVAAAAITPSAGEPAQPVAVAGEASAPRPGTAVLGAQALPSGGARQETTGSGMLPWAAALALLAVVGGSAFTLYRARR